LPQLLLLSKIDHPNLGEIDERYRKMERETERKRKKRRENKKE